ncbi:MAG: hypothetical protein SH807_10250 [Blastochloris sp.]|nr:hypothetical protein [Blastochloris sp.]
MTDSNSTSSCTVFLSLSLLAISLLLLLSWQLVISVQTKQNLQTQVDQPQRKQAMEESKKVQINLEKIVIDLMALSETDSDAKEIVAKHQIKRTKPATPGK